MKTAGRSGTDVSISAPEHTPIPVWLISGFGILLVLLYARSLHAPCDDAYIFLVYAKNLLGGAGLTFNGERVEGFTSPFWVALLCAFGLTRMSLPAIMEGLSMASGVVALAATYWLGRRAGLPATWALLPSGLLAATGDFAFYMATGMETALFTALVAACTALALGADDRDPRRGLVFPCALAALVLTRPDGALVAALLLGALWLTNGSIVLSMRCALVLGALLAPVMVVKWLYYGSWLPNTYYAKSGMGFSNLPRGIGYLARALPRYLGALFGLALLVVIAVRRRRLPERVASRLVLWIVPPVWLLYVAVEGGDNLVGGRVLVPVLPLVYTGGVWLASRLRWRLVAAVALGIAVLGVGSYALDDRVQSDAERWRRSYPIRRAAGSVLRENFPPDTLVALNPAGVIPYYSELPTLDMLGLNDVHIARHGRRDSSLKYGHQAGDGAYVLARRPGVILFGSTLTREATRGVSSREIWASPIFHERYVLTRWPNVGYAYVRTDDRDDSDR